MLIKPRRAVFVCACLLLVGGCTVRMAGPATAPATSSAAEEPSRERVVWANSVCSATARLAGEQASGRELTTAPADEFTAMQAHHYLTFVSSSVSRLAEEFGTLPESGIAEADRYVASLAAGLARIEPEVARLAGGPAARPSPQEVRPDHLTRIVELIDSVEPEGPDLATLARENPEFAAAYELAPDCEPVAPSSTATAPLPPAADGTDLTACADGTCEVTLSGTVPVRVGSFQLKVTVADGGVRVVHSFEGNGGSMATLGSAGSEASFGSGGDTLTIRSHGVADDTAVVEFTTE